MKFFTLFFMRAMLCAGEQVESHDSSSGLRGVTQVRPPRELLQEFEEELGKEHREAAERKLHEYEKDLQATFTALPKNERGAIEAPSVRYALHRLFNQRHGWQVKGLENSGGAWDAASPIHAMGPYVPPEMRELFEDRLGSYGLDLHELAVLAATMDNMFHKDVARRLDLVLQAEKRDRNVSVDLKGAQKIFHAYVSSFIMGGRVQSTIAQVILNQWNYEKYYSRRQEVQQLLHDIVTKLEVEYFDYDLILSAMADFGRKLGGIEDKQCKTMKKLLLEHEQYPGNGRVRLGDFYREHSEHFTESVKALRDHGALDESNPKDVSVIIPNYLHSPTNCVTPSGYYEVCCFDECEALMDHIEVEVAAPSVSPERIASVVASLEVGRDYNRSRGDLTPNLKKLLGDIANYHSGQVPIHGRLFAQWMHQAFPRECAHPSEAWHHDRFEMTNPALSSVIIADVQEKEKYREQLQSITTKHTWEKGHEPIGLWQMQEQLVDHKSHEKHVSKSSDMTDIVTFAAAGVVGTILLQLTIGPSMKARRRKDLKLL